jgi:hypothetical protein
VNGSNILAGTNNGVYISTNNGSSWVTAGLSGNKITALTINGDTILAGTSSLGVWKRSLSEMIAMSCSAIFTIAPDITTPHLYYVTSYATGIPPLKYLWSWGDGTHDSIAYPSHIYSTAGYYTICLSITDSGGCTSTYCDSSAYLSKSTNSIITVEVVPNIITGINEQNFSNLIKIYPNPAANTITIESPPAVIEITNIQGQLIKTLPPCGEAGATTGNKTNIDVSALPSGVYVVEVRTEKGVAVSKFIKE